MTKNISQNGIKTIEKLEGCILHAYRDIAGVPTIGVGHTGGVAMGMTITQTQADELLRRDLEKFVERVNHFVKVPLNQNQFDALVSFDFNTGALGTSTLLKKLNAGDYKGAAAEFAVWNKITDPETGKKVVATGLANRRKAEAALFNTPVKATPVAKPKAPAYPGHTLEKNDADHKNVTVLQKYLKITADGIFGKGTEAAVIKFQKAHGLTADGIVGPKTWAAIVK